MQINDELTVASFDVTTNEANAAPLGETEFAELLQPLLADYPPAPLALAVSGGPDSMALTFCCHRWQKQNADYPITALIVDHALRPESRNEVEQTTQRLDSLGIKSHILRWEHNGINSRLHEAARNARYELLFDACKQLNIDTLLLAHQREDQAETILMRIAKGSGVDGLAGMESSTERKGVLLLRPLLTIPKARLIATCHAASLHFIKDPSNLSTKYARGRLRRIMPLLAKEGLSIERLIDLGNRAREAREALDHATRALLNKGARLETGGSITLNLPPFRQAPTAIALRALGICLQAINLGPYQPERAALVDLLQALTITPATVAARTLHGCVVSRSNNQARLVRELANIKDAQEMKPGENIAWDNRWRVSLDKKYPKTLTVRALGRQTNETLDRLAPELRRAIPQGRVRATMPALWDGDVLTIIPSIANKLTNAPAQAEPLWHKDLVGKN